MFFGDDFFIYHLGKYNDEVKEEDIKKDKEKFLYYKDILFDLICKTDSNSKKLEIKNNPKQMYKMIKEKLKIEEEIFFIEVGFNDFLCFWYLELDKLDENQKEELFQSKIDYDVIKNFAIKVFDKYIKDCKKILPKEIHICFEEIMFVRYAYMYGEKKININNFIHLIRDYFIIELNKEGFKRYRNENIYNDIREKIINIYPKLKDRYGMNRKLEYFLSFFSSNTDYNYKITNDILNNYYNQKNNNYIPIKQKED